MKVAILGNAANRHTHRWAAYMAARGHEVRVFSDEQAPPHLDYAGIRLVPPNWSLVRLAIVFKLGASPYANNRHKWHAYKRAIHAWKPDVLHAHEALAYGPMLAHFPGFARVLTPWGGDIERLRGGDDEPKRLVLSALQAAHVISTNAPGRETEWARLADVPADRFRLFSWGVDLEVFRPRAVEEQRAIRELFGLAADTPFLLSPRLARAAEDVALLAGGWERAAAAAPMQRHHLVVLRAGASSELWDRWRERAGGSRRVQLVDAVLSPAQMAAAYSAAHAIASVLPRDLLALSILEALACGCVPILSDLPVYRDNLAGAQPFFVEDRPADALADAMLRAAALSRAEREAAARRNAAFAREHHDWRRQAPLMESAYELALDHQRKPPAPR